MNTCTKLMLIVSVTTIIGCSEKGVENGTISFGGSSSSNDPMSYVSSSSSSKTSSDDTVKDLSSEAHFSSAKSVSSSKRSSSSSILIRSSSSSEMNYSQNRACDYVESSDSLSNSGELRCEEGTYKTIKINGQIWMAENLNFGQMINGQYYAPKYDDTLIVQKFCNDNVEENCETYGALYNWSEMMGLPSYCNNSLCKELTGGKVVQGVCPNGWHIPNDSAWKYGLIDYVGSDAGSKLKANNTEFDAWNNSMFNSGDPYKFSILPAGGFTFSMGGSFDEVGSYVAYAAHSYSESWISNEYYLYGFYKNEKSVWDIYDMSNTNKNDAHPVRCIKDK